MRSGVPWSVKGIEPEAREAAKQAARRAGVTLGVWLNQIIMDTGTDEVGQQEPPAMQNRYSTPGQSAPHASIPEPKIDLGPVVEAVRELVQRVDNSERRTAEMTRKLEATVGQLAERIEQPEHDMGERYSENRSIDPLERKLQMLGERMERAERGRGGLRPEDQRTIQTLEKAVNAVVDHLETTEQRTDSTLGEIREALASLGLAQYAAAFEAAGYDDLDYLLSLASRADGQARVDGVAAAAAMRPGHASKLAAYLRGAWEGARST